MYSFDVLAKSTIIRLIEPLKREKGQKILAWGVYRSHIQPVYKTPSPPKSQAS